MKTLIVIAVLTGSVSAWAADSNAKKSQATPPSSQSTQNSQAAAQNNRADRMNVEALKQKYWATGEEADLQVVQNRKYGKAGKFEIGLFAGTVATDPFLSVKNVGFRAGYNLNEMFGFSLLWWKDIAKGSTALTDLEAQTSPRQTANTNIPKTFYGGAFEFSPIYGKLSLIGKAIIYYDMRLSLGAGLRNSETGNFFTMYFGVGQKIWITKFMSLGLDYRLLRFTENIVDKNGTGNTYPSRTNWTDVITIGVDFLFGV